MIILHDLSSKGVSIAFSWILGNNCRTDFKMKGFGRFVNCINSHPSLFTIGWYNNVKKQYAEMLIGLVKRERDQLGKYIELQASFGAFLSWLPPEHIPPQ